MKFKTLRTSETGLVIAKIEKASRAAFSEAKKLIKELGTDRYRSSRDSVYGGISSIIYDDETKVPPYMKRAYDGMGFMPKRSTKEGMLLQKRIEDLPIVTRQDINESIGYKDKDSFFNTIGFSWSNKKYFVFSLNENWKYTAPKDCEEITKSEYDKLSK